MNRIIHIEEPRGRRRDREEGFSIFSYGFRPFFLAAGIYAILPLIPWALYLSGVFEPTISLQAWHAHEMLFGFIAAGASGFLLTAIPNWTGAPPMIGTRLKGLFLCWLAGRFVFWLYLFVDHSVLNYLLFIDLLLPILHGTHITRILMGTKQKRNYIFIGIMTMFVIANSLFILEFNNLTSNTAQVGGLFIANIVMVMIAIVGGRVTPNFTRSWLRTQNIEENIRSFPWIEKMAIGSLIVNATLELFIPDSSPVYAVALFAAVVHLIRFSQWNSLKTLYNPALWVLHLGYFWLIASLFLKAFEGWLNLPYHLYLHAFTVGAVGSYMLGIMSRAALGHTGRALSVSPPITTAYLLILAATLIRIATPFYPEYFVEGMVSTIALWSAAFALYVWVYAPILTSPRVDGKPG